MSSYGRGKKEFQTTVRFSKKFVEYMDFHAKKLNLTRNVLIERAVDFAIANLDYFQSALIRLDEAQKRFDSAATENDVVNAFRELGKAMKI